MNREILKDLLPIMQAFVDGKKIEYSSDGEDWIETETPTWDTDFVYRIKPEPKCRPFKSQEECWNEMHKHPDFGWVIRSGVYLNISGVYCDTICTLEDSNGIHFDYAFLELTFTDGAPFGVKEE